MIGISLWREADVRDYVPVAGGCQPASGSPGNSPRHGFASSITRANEGRALRWASQAAAFFDTLDRADRYAVLYRLHDATDPAARARRIVRYVAMLVRGEKFHG